MPEGAYTPKNLSPNLEVEMLDSAEAPGRRWSTRISIAACFGLCLMAWLVLVWGVLGLAG